MNDCLNADIRKVGNCTFSICKEQAAGDCELCRTSLILNIDGCSCETFQSEYEAAFFIRGNTGGNCYMTRRSFWDEIKDIRWDSPTWETDSSSCTARTRKPIVKQNIDLLMQQSNITICNDPSRRKFDFHVKVFDKNGKFIIRSEILEQIRIDQSVIKTNELKYLAFVIIPVLFIIGMGSYFVFVIRLQKDKLNLTALLERAISLWKRESEGMCDLIEGERVNVKHKIGEGHFGEVFLGELSGLRNDSNIPKMNSKLPESTRTGQCAIKTVRRQNDMYKEEMELRKLIMESSRCQHFKHFNVIKFYGMVLANEKNEVWIAMELMDGCLDKLLHDTRYQIPFATQIKILTDAAQGMEHVAEKGFVHRDIACRNIMYSIDISVKKSKTIGPCDINCKIGDFGLSEKMKFTNGYSCHQETKHESNLKPKEVFPLYLWAPECQWGPKDTRFFTEYSDVFTFGMLIWELFQIFSECREKCSWDKQKECTGGYCKAYKILTREDYLTPRHEKLPIPKLLEIENDATKVLKQRMLACWSQRQKARRGFTELKRELEQIESMVRQEPNQN